VEYFDREQKKITREEVCAEGHLRFLYSTRTGRFLNEAIFSRRLFNRLLGRYWDSRFSRRLIRPFIARYGISMDEYAIPAEGFPSFNSFFSRKFRVGARPFAHEGKILCSPVEGKLLAREGVTPELTISIKGTPLSVAEVFRRPLEEYRDGTLLIFRLYLADYHRFHFCDAGVAGPPTKIPGRYYSVSPMGFLSKPHKFHSRNHRHVTILSSDHFGEVLISEVGGFCVGSIVQTHTPGSRVKRGEEKGYFAFGGSTVILLFRLGTVCIDSDILDRSRREVETRVLLGTPIGKACTAQSGKHE
jgi:phosphatidylserine decarboxylase